MITHDNSLDSLIPFEEFKLLLGLDDRDDKLSRFCLTGATLAIEQFCRRKLLYKRHVEISSISGDMLVILNEYPVKSISSVTAVFNRDFEFGNELILKPDFYNISPDCGESLDIPSYFFVSPILKRNGALKAIKTVYFSGYKVGAAPLDLASACLELAAWTMNRYKGRRIGMTGKVRGNGKDGEHFELSMPESVNKLLEPYKRKLI